jgi:hypothetical protein
MSLAYSISVRTHTGAGLLDSKLAIKVVPKQVNNPEKRNNRHEDKQCLHGPMHLR